jgi:hypothetical protein
VEGHDHNGLLCSKAEMYEVHSVGQIMKGEFNDWKVLSFDESELQVEESIYLHHRFDLDWLAETVPQADLTFEEHIAALKKLEFVYRAKVTHTANQFPTNTNCDMYLVSNVQ